jgi:hypothetical protein
MILQTYLTGDDDWSCHCQLWLQGEKELAITLWKNRKITCDLEKMMFLYANQKYGPELFECQLSGIYWDLALHYNTKNPQKMIRAMAKDRGN